MMLGLVAVAVVLSLTPAGAIPPPVYEGPCHEGQTCICVTGYVVQRHRDGRTQPIWLAPGTTYCFEPIGH
jgi:hypothetical protein